MTFDLQKIIASKRQFRAQLAARPIAEKLALLDQLRESALAICAGRRTQPFCLRIFVTEGDPDGLRLVACSNWVSKAVMFPRASVGGAGNYYALRTGSI